MAVINWFCKSLLGLGANVLYLFRIITRTCCIYYIYCGCTVLFMLHRPTIYAMSLCLSLSLYVCLSLSVSVSVCLSVSLFLSLSLLGVRTLLKMDLAFYSASTNCGMR